MRRHADMRTGAVTGRSAEAAGINGTAVLPPHRLRYPATSGSIPGISTPGRWSGSANFNRSVTVTSQATPSCGSTIRSATSGRTQFSGAISETSGAGIKISDATGIGIGKPR